MSLLSSYYSLDIRPHRFITLGNASSTASRQSSSGDSVSSSTVVFFELDPCSGLGSGAEVGDLGLFLGVDGLAAGDGDLEAFLDEADLEAGDADLETLLGAFLGATGFEDEALSILGDPAVFREFLVFRGLGGLDFALAPFFFASAASLACAAVLALPFSLAARVGGLPCFLVTFLDVLALVGGLVTFVALVLAFALPF